MRTHDPKGSITWWHPAAAAFQLLSRIPFPVQVPFEERVLSRSVVFYPAVGLVIGLLLAGAGTVLSAVLPVEVSAALLAGLWVALTGGLHLDGLMDTADGLLSHRSRERMLEIMKDSRVGAMGVMACVLQLLLKYALLHALLEAQWPLAAGLLAAAPVWSRWFMVAAVVSWPYAREGQPGMGSYFSGAGSRHLLGASLLAAIGSAVLLGWLAGDWRDAIVLSAGASVTAGCAGLLVAVRMAGKLGGLTGDTYGAINEIVETVLLLASVLYLYNL
ncbi:adenosylcobinamide-GDP ribazoletransferase [Gorillibacterium sp. sgz5001074]|uniref:adenosylcobinamide-GDP ribazoletransferase n=1 Tax=Gorillibacterium sp. sgz5001074 TaxID=3446695 RepID=UPI003F67DB72